jgi:dihydrolipoamide dehydrogenase
MKKVPASIVIVGGGAVAIELSQMLAAYGSRVTLVQRSRLLRREDPAVSDTVAEMLRGAGIDVLLGVSVEAVRQGDGHVRAELSDGGGLEAEVLLIATGRRPRSADVGLESAGLAADGGIAVDELGRAAPGLWAIGDVTGVAKFTHVAKYMGRTVAANIVADLRSNGPARTLDFSAVPRVVFSHPEVAAVGLTEERAREKGTPVKVATVAMTSLTRPYIHERQPHGMLRLVAHAESGVVLGASMVAPLAGEYINLAALAVKAGLTVSFLRDSIIQYPTFSEAYIAAAEELAP